MNQITVVAKTAQFIIIPFGYERYWGARSNPLWEKWEQVQQIFAVLKHQSNKCIGFNWNFHHMCVYMLKIRITLDLVGRLFRSLIWGTTVMSIPPMCHCKRGDGNPNWKGHTLSSTMEYNTTHIGEIIRKLCLKKQTIQQACKFMWSLKQSNHEQINLHQRFIAGHFKSNQMWRSWAAR